MIIAWYHWAIAGVVMGCAEMLVPAFVLIWLGLAALVMAALVAVWPQTGMIVECVIWAALSAVFVLMWFKLFKPRQRKIPPQIVQTQAIGEVGLLIRDVAPFEKGQVRFQTSLIGADVWDCIADQQIKTGAHVEVISVEGNLLRVKPTV